MKYELLIHFKYNQESNKVFANLNLCESCQRKGNTTKEVFNNENDLLQCFI